MLFPQVKAGELAAVVRLPVEPTPTVTMDIAGNRKADRYLLFLRIVYARRLPEDVVQGAGRIAVLLSQKIILLFACYLPDDWANRDFETQAPAVYHKRFRA